VGPTTTPVSVLWSDGSSAHGNHNLWLNTFLEAGHLITYPCESIFRDDGSVLMVRNSNHGRNCYIVSTTALQQIKKIDGVMDLGI